MQFVVELRNRRASVCYQGTDKSVHFENSIVSKKLYIKLLKIQVAIFACNLLSLFNAYLIFDAGNVLDWSSPLSNQFFGPFGLHDVLLLFQSLLSAFLLCAYVFNERLVWQNRLKRGIKVGSFVRSLAENWKEVLACTLLEVLHPNYIWAHIELWNEGNTFGFEVAPNGQKITYSMNDLCCALALTRGVIVFVLITYRLDYNSDISFRVW